MLLKSMKIKILMIQIQVLLLLYWRDEYVICNVGKTD